jgi:hypothetical protein
MLLPISFSLPGQSSLSTQKKPITFGQQLTFGPKNSDNPWDVFVAKMAENPPKHQMPAQDKQLLQTEIVHLMHELQKDCGVLSPVKSDIPTEELIAKQSVSIPPTLDPDLAKRGSKAREAELES